MVEMSSSTILREEVDYSPYKDEKGKGKTCVFTGKNNSWVGSSVKYQDGTTVFTFPADKLSGKVKHIICKERIS